MLRFWICLLMLLPAAAMAQSPGDRPRDRDKAQIKQFRLFRCVVRQDANTAAAIVFTPGSQLDTEVIRIRPAFRVCMGRTRSQLAEEWTSFAVRGELAMIFLAEPQLLPKRLPPLPAISPTDDLEFEERIGACVVSAQPDLAARFSDPMASAIELDKAWEAIRADSQACLNRERGEGAVLMANNLRYGVAVTLVRAGLSRPATLQTATDPAR